MGTYVVGDIHGCYDEWMELKDKIEAQDSSAKFILVGDIIDRGKQNCEMIQWAMENITEDGKYQMVLGNHENEKIQWWEDYLNFTEGISLKEGSTLSFRDYGHDRYNFFEDLARTDLNDRQVNEIINWFKGLPLYKELWIDTGVNNKKQHYIVVHASVINCLNQDETFKKSSIKLKKAYDMLNVMKVDDNKQHILWDRLTCGYSWLKHTIVVHGHTPTALPECIASIEVDEGRAFYRHGDINVDCGLVYDEFKNRNLCAIRLEDLEEFYLYNNEYTQNPRHKAYKDNMIKMLNGGKYKKVKYD